MAEFHVTGQVKINFSNISVSSRLTVSHLDAPTMISIRDVLFGYEGRIIYSKMDTYVEANSAEQAIKIVSEQIGNLDNWNIDMEISSCLVDIYVGNPIVEILDIQAEQEE